MWPRSTAVLLACAGIAVSSAAALPASAPSQELSFANGAEALLVPRAGSGSVLVAVSIGAGGQDEPKDRTGMSHFLEHLLFDGFDALDERGVTEAFEGLSSYVNAFTRDQATVYFALSPTTEAAKASELLAGMLTRSTISAEAFEKERKVILEELAREASQGSIVRDHAAREVLWQDSPWERSAGGTPRTVEAATREEVVRFWKRHYVPAAMRVLAIGDASPAVLRAIVAPFERLPAPASTSLASRSSPLSFPHWGTWGSAPPGEEEPQLTLAIAPASSAASGGAALEILAAWLTDAGGQLAGSLLGHGAAKVSAYRLPRRPVDLLEVTITASEGEEPRTLLSRALGALEAASAGPTDAETERLSRAWLSDRALSRQRLHYTAVLDGEAVASAPTLSSAIDPPAPSGEQVRALAASLLAAPSARVRAVWSGPGGPAGREQLPPSTPPASRPSAALEAGPAGSRVATLPNGLVLGVLEEPGSPVFGLHLLVADRSAREPAGQGGVADLAHRLLGGGSELSPGEAFERRLQRAAIDLRPADLPMIPMDDRYHLPDWSYVRMEGPAEELDAAIELLAEMVFQPRWDEKAWDAALAEHRQSRRAGAEGSARLDAAVREKILGAAHPLARPPSGPPEGPVPSVEQVRAFWGGYFDPAAMILTIASSRDAGTLLERVSEVLGSGTASPPWRFAYPAPPAAAPGAPALPAAQPATSPEPSSPPAGMPGIGSPPPQKGLAWARIARIPPEERAALLVAMSALEDRMTAELRERQGLLYRHQAGVRPLPGSEWLLSASFSTRPENVETAVAAFEKLLGGLRSVVRTSDDLARMSARARRRMMLDGQAAVSRAYGLGRRLFEGDDSPLAVTLDQIQGVTPDAVREAAARWLDPVGFVRIEP